MSNKIKMHHSTRWNGFVGLIESEEMYEDVKLGKKDWTPHQKHIMKAVQIPVELFNRLLSLDKTVTTVPFEIEINKGAE